MKGGSLFARVSPDKSHAYCAMKHKSSPGPPGQTAVIPSRGTCGHIRPCGRLTGAFTISMWVSEQDIIQNVMIKSRHASCRREYCISIGYFCQIEGSPTRTKKTALQAGIDRQRRSFLAAYRSKSLLSRWFIHLSRGVLLQLFPAVCARSWLPGLPLRRAFSRAARPHAPSFPSGHDP